MWACCMKYLKLWGAATSVLFSFLRYNFFTTTNNSWVYKAIIRCVRQTPLGSRTPTATQISKKVYVGFPSTIRNYSKLRVRTVWGKLRAKENSFSSI